MAIDRFLIAPYDKDSGHQTNYKPWLIPDTAFSEIINAYVFRGRVRKRFGSRFLANTANQSRLRIFLGTTEDNSFSGNLFDILNNEEASLSVGQAFSIFAMGAGEIFFTVYNSSAGPQQMYRTDGSISSATFDLATSNLVIDGIALPNGSPVFFYPALPVMGLVTYETGNVVDETIIGFDTEFAYVYSGTNWSRLNVENAPGASVWSGSNSQFFWGTTWTGASPSDRILFVTNFNVDDGLRYFDGTYWYFFQPQIDSSNYLFSAQIVVPFKNRLLYFNTYEGTNSAGASNYSARCRYSAVGSPFATNAWRQDIPGQGNAIDAATTQSIITVEFIKDRLIVFFEQSTWELAYTGNQAYPFTWQQINTELGAESTFSVVPFDKIALGVGNVGIMACNGANVERIDDKIPQEVFEIHNTDAGVDRVYGIRDYFVEMVYWTFPGTDASSFQPYPNRVLTYNYKTGTWAFNIDSITAFGYYQPLGSITWLSETITWSDQQSWSSGSLESRFRSVLAGNQEGFTFICDSDVTTNAQALQITNLVNSNGTITITSIDHNMRVGEFVYLDGIVSSGTLSDLNNTIFKIIGGPTFTANTFGITTMESLSGTYQGGGLIARVSQISIKTKEYNFYAQKGRNAYVSKVDFMVDKTNAGQIQVNFFVSTAQTPLLQDGMGTDSTVGTGNLDTFPYTYQNMPYGVEAPIQFEETAVRLWHPVYFQADGEVVQFQLIMNDSQMENINIWPCDFQLHAICIFAQPTAMRFQ